jgi:hypothetical protein
VRSRFSLLKKITGALMGFEGNSSGIKGHLALRTKCCFTVSGPKRSLDVQAPSEGVKDDWVSALKLMGAYTKLGSLSSHAERIKLEDALVSQSSEFRVYSSLQTANRLSWPYALPSEQRRARVAPLRAAGGGESAVAREPPDQAQAGRLPGVRAAAHSRVGQKPRHSPQRQAADQARRQPVGAQDQVPPRGARRRASASSLGPRADRALRLVAVLSDRSSGVSRPDGTRQSARSKAQWHAPVP